MKIAFLHKEDDFASELLREIRAGLPQHDLASWRIGETPPAHDYEILITLGATGREQMADQPKLVLVQTASTGYDAVDVDAASELGIWVSYAPSDETGNAASVAEYAILLMLATARHLPQFISPAPDGKALPSLIQPALKEKTVCIVGVGAVGEMLVARLRPFGMTIVATDEHPERTPASLTTYRADHLNRAVADADFVVLCVRAGKENENLIDAAMLRAMKKGAILINIARGTLIDEEALLSALKEGHIAAAGLDVLKNEPPASDDPLLALPQVLVTPHIAGFTDLMLHGTAWFLVDTIKQVAAGRKPKSVLNTPEKPRLALQ